MSNSSQFANIQRVLDENGDALMEKHGVEVVYIGFKEVNGKETDEYAIVCGVKKKIAKELINEKDLVPSSVDDITTDVVETGEITVFGNTGKQRPAPPGISIGHFAVTAGTFGCVVTDNKTGEEYILSNNHVLANSNNAKIGDAIYQPGRHDGGNANDTIAHLHAFVPINFGGALSKCPIVNIIIKVLNWFAKLFGRKTRLQAVQPQAADNHIDAAIAKPIEPNDIVKDIIDIGVPIGSAQGILGQSVKKSGRTTGFTTGRIKGVNARTKVNYGNGKVALFKNQFIMGPMSKGGDSGSAILDNNNQVIALLFAGSDDTTIASPIQYALQAFNVRV